MEDDRPSVQKSLEQVMDLLRRHELVDSLLERQEAPRQDLVADITHRRNLAELSRKLDQLHPADVAYILEALPREQRLTVWDLVRQERDGEILLEVSDAVRESLIAHMEAEELVAAAEHLDADELADLAPDLPRAVMDDVFESLSVAEREQLRAAMSYPEDSVGALMNFDMIEVREGVTAEVVLRYLRRWDELPGHTDQLFVVDREENLRGLLPVSRLLVADLSATVASIMLVDDVIGFRPDQDARDAAGAFERYDLVSAPVTDRAGKLIGRVTVDAVVDFIRERSEHEKRSAGGLREDEDLFAPVWNSVRNRWLWLALNLVTAFVASRVIGLFEDSIEKLVALAALMPIVAGIGGNSGNQTITMIVRGLAVGQVNPANAIQLLRKEVGVALVNGVVWGSVLGFVAFLLYGSWHLGLVMSGAMLLNLLLAAMMGFLIPMAMHHFGKDPVRGASVMITAITDSGGFFIFLGLATVFLV